MPERPLHQPKEGDLYSKAKGILRKIHCLYDDYSTINRNAKRPMINAYSLNDLVSRNSVVKDGFALQLDANPAPLKYQVSYIKRANPPSLPPIHSIRLSTTPSSSSYPRSQPPPSHTTMKFTTSTTITILALALSVTAATSPPKTTSAGAVPTTPVCVAPPPGHKGGALSNVVGIEGLVAGVLAGVVLSFL
ncbi:hypothetical protein BDN72DRAFT_958584 [Pluteus cervinus]|uniref:Uncharacterized protein n=1 Tax=Pluteus cervinus TaxID=181527 RepID=A0ACD3AZE3_9AGAR|nr:hypothetical protein BDN72DRAFT_958584 [Pluteus cervinus]